VMGWMGDWIDGGNDDWMIGLMDNSTGGCVGGCVNGWIDVCLS